MKRHPSACRATLHHIVSAIKNHIALDPVGIGAILRMGRGSA